MYNILQIFNLFPYPHLWRISKEQYHSDKCSILLSLVIFLAIGGLFAQRLTTVIRKESISSTSQTIITPSPPPTIIMTTQQHPQTKPFMMAFNLYAANPQLNRSDTSLQVSAYVDYIQGGVSQNRTDHNDTIQLEACTTNHFQMIPNIEKQFVNWGGSNWLCLPLNKNYTIQGSWNLDGLYSSINILFNCSGNCHNTVQTINIEFFLLSSIVNPHNSTNPQQYFLQESMIPLRKSSFLEYSYDLTQNKIITDKSLLPWSSEEEIKSIKPEPFQFIYQEDNLSESTTLVYFERSTRTITHKRSYMKLMDAVSYVGGMFEAIIGLFCFMVVFGRIFYEFKFAGKYFRNQLSKSLSFKSFIQQLGFKIMQKMKCEPNWSQAKQRDQMQKTINHLLDVVYLQKRIDFLQKAVTIVLEEHQIKGLHLIHDLTVEEANKNHKKYQLRDLLVSYLHQKQKDIDYSLQTQDYFKWSLFQKDYYKQLQQMCSGQHMNRHEMTDKLPDIRRPIESNVSNIEIQIPPQPLNKPSKSISFQNRPTQLGKGKPMSSANSIYESKDNLNFDQPLGRRKSRLDSVSLKENFDMLRQTVAEVGENEKAMDHSYLRKELESDLARLMEEAQRPEGDVRSKRIYACLDDWLKTMLKAVVRPKRAVGEQRQLKKRTLSEREQQI